MNTDKLKQIGFYTLQDKRAEHTSATSPLWRCELLLTSKCNFNCPYCRGTDTDANITFDHAKQIVDIWTKQQLKHVRFSGGEPTCVKWLPDLIKYTANKPSIENIALSTNGSASFDYYKQLIQCGVTDFSISLDACCSEFGDKMTGVAGSWKTVINNIKELSKIVYVTTGCVFDENNVNQSLETVKFAHDLGVADIRIISSAQFNEALQFVKQIPQYILDAHPILNYRVQNFLKGRNVRGINSTDNHYCPLVLDDMAIKGEYHYPCIIKLREGCRPIGHVNENIRKSREQYYRNHNCYQDSICRKNCLDVCIDYNNRFKQLNQGV